MLNSFGSAVAIDGRTLAVGVPRDSHLAYQTGAVFLYVMGDDDQPELAQRLYSDRPHDGAGFGYRLALRDDVLAIATPAHTSRGRPAIIEIFQRQVDGLWELAQTIEAPMTTPYLGFGMKLELASRTLWVSAGSAGWGEFKLGGLVYRYEQNDLGVWMEVGVLMPPDPRGGDGFGWDLAISGDTLVVGALNSGPDHQGAAYVFRRSDNGDWTVRDKLFGHDSVMHDRFGAGVAVHDSTVFVGASQDKDMGQLSGSAFVFSPDPCRPDWDQSGELNSFDLAAFLVDWGEGKPWADLNLDGLIDTRDVLVFVNEWSQGCP